MTEYPPEQLSSEEIDLGEDPDLSVLAALFTDQEPRARHPEDLMELSESEGGPPSPRFGPLSETEGVPELGPPPGVFDSLSTEKDDSENAQSSASKNKESVVDLDEYPEEAYREGERKLSAHDRLAIIAKEVGKDIPPAKPKPPRSAPKKPPAAASESESLIDLEEESLKKPPAAASESESLIDLGDEDVAPKISVSEERKEEDVIELMGEEDVSAADQSLAEEPEERGGTFSVPAAPSEIVKEERATPTGSAVPSAAKEALAAEPAAEIADSPSRGTGWRERFSVALQQSSKKSKESRTEEEKPKELSIKEFLAHLTAFWKEKGDLAAQAESSTRKHKSFAGTDVSAPSVAEKLRDRIEPSERRKSRFAELLAPVSEAELALLQQDVVQERPIFVRLERARQHSLRRQRIGLFLGFLVLLFFAVHVGTAYLNTGLTDAAKAYHGWPHPSQSIRNAFNGVWFGLGILLPLAAVFILAEAVNRVWRGLEDWHIWDLVSGFIALACAGGILNALTSSRVNIALLFAVVWLAVLALGGILQSRQARKSRPTQKRTNS